ncbi:RNA polymerase I associated factor, A49-like protein [Pisolithus tinctorius]|nr:RNA polymerase I associated factor, A49-like protein [Pisolithus tinctorius]
MTAFISKKCKCSEARDDAKASLVLSTQPKSQLGPVLANFPSVKPSKSTTFSCYQTTDDKKAVGNSDDAEFVDLPTLLAGETDSVAFHSANQATGCRYLVGVHDKKTGKTTIRPAPLHILTRDVKALKGQEPIAVSVLQRLEARAALGESFGTKKAKLAIKAQERNKVDVSAMETVVDHLQESIQKSTQALPSKGSLFRSLYIASTYLRGSSEEAQATADSTRLVPPYNAEATVPSEVYPLHNIIPETEWKTLSEAPFLVVGQNQRIPLLPFQRSKWINQHLHSICDSSSPSKTNIKILQYIAYMMLFRQLAIQSNLGKVSLQDKLTSMPSVVADGLLSRFTESARTSSKSQFTSQKETLLLTHMFALCLRVDEYATNIEIIAKDLSQSTQSINTLFKSMGCQIAKPTVADLKRLGLPDSAAETKRALLKVPLEFPKPRGKRRRG